MRSCFWKMASRWLPLAVMVLLTLTSSAWGQRLGLRRWRPCDCCPMPLPPVAVETTTPSTEPTPKTPATEPAKEKEPEPTAPAASLFSNITSMLDTTATSGDTLSLFDSSVGYIDNAIPVSMFTVRYDSAYTFRRPSRAEYFYAKGGIDAPGLPLPEASVDYQEFIAHLEYACSRRCSIFAEGGGRLLNPEINNDHGGGTDTILGVKYAFLEYNNLFVTGQMKTFLPTGNARLGLGTRHFSMEPGLLVHERFCPLFALDLEARYWVPIGGTDFAGNVFRYGIGLTLGQPSPQRAWITPVAELVGWYVLGGNQAVVGPGGVAEESANGDHIVNLKLGARVGWQNQYDVYMGYGNALTGTSWYESIFRIEFRLYY